MWVQAATVAATTGETIRALTSSWQTASRRVRIRAIAGVVAVFALSALLVTLPIDYRSMGEYGYVGVFVVTLISTGALILPVPYLATIYVAGSFLDPWTVALVAGVAAALGELTGYFLGYSGRQLIPRGRWYAMVQESMSRYGGPVIFLAAVVPNPFFDAVGAMAGATRMKVWVFLVSAFLGKTLRFLLIAAAGYKLIGG